jgi:hypothetical protein
MKSQVFFENANVNGKVFPFIKGIIITSKSLVQVHHDLISKYKVSFIITGKLDQDVLENFFGVIRQMGSLNDHISALDFKHRIKKCVLGRKQTLVALEPNTSLARDDDAVAYGIKHFTNASAASQPLESPCLTSDVLRNISLPTEDSTSDCSLPIPENEEQAFIYVLGFIAHRFPQVSSNLVDPGSWTDHVNKGALTSMKSELIPYFRAFESVFRQPHGLYLKPGPAAIAQLMSYVDETCDLPQHTVRFHFRTRLNFRIR